MNFCIHLILIVFSNSKILIAFSNNSGLCFLRHLFWKSSEIYYSSGSQQSYLISFLDINEIELRSTSCTRDSDCDTDNCYYCLSTGICSQFNDEYCDDNECGEGDGDCDGDEQCSPLICGTSNFHSFHPLLIPCNNPTSIISPVTAPLSTEEVCATCKDKNGSNVGNSRYINNLVFIVNLFSFTLLF